ncbi:hypothetical protein OsJ_22965 [Oryza sativa Japonica Group]|uniref:F-box domain-containing protein n=1 Tax=Oryza sativa subsp. japonica TaxID=39947 RepID=B9FVB9_ORYSJ|nr:hypothetical protein OsJ_22965 [Oryza sativa Japonica Group]
MDSGDGRRRRRSQSEGATPTDRISALPDELLHGILLRVGCARDAARTAALSRRWRRVWATMPELHLRRSAWTSSPTSAVSLVDGALAGYSAPTLRLLDIDVPGARLAVATHVAPWLRFAGGKRPRGALIRLRSGRYGYGAGEEEVLDLPVCGAATAIHLCLVSHLHLRPPPGGAFAALATAKIQSCRVDGGELGRLVSSPQCPRLEELYLINVALVAAAASDVAISSASLRRLRFGVCDTRRLDVDAPELRFLSVSNAGEARVTAGKVEEVAHTGDMDRYEYTQLGRHLRRLEIDLTSPMAAFLGRLDTVGELSLHLAFQSELSDWSQQFEKLVEEMSKLPECEALEICPAFNHSHGFLPIAMHLLRRFAGIRKLSVNLWWVKPPCPPELVSYCPCRTLTDDLFTDNNIIMLCHLEEIEIDEFRERDEQVEFVNQLLRCNVPLLERVVFNVPSCCFPESEEIIREKIHGKLRGDKIKVRFKIRRYFSEFAHLIPQPKKRV